jgi:c(7)-type cytochrome triheme protein
MSKAYNYRFTHQVHAQREGIKCVECHNVLQSESAAQVSVPQLREHRGAGFQGCGSCHNGRRAFGGELVSNACIRCHGRNMM